MPKYLIGTNQIPREFPNDFEAISSGCYDLWKIDDNNIYLKFDHSRAEWEIDEGLSLIKWIEKRINSIERAKESIEYKDNPASFVGKSAQVTAFKQVLEFYRSHFLSQDPLSKQSKRKKPNV